MKHKIQTYFWLHLQSTDLLPVEYKVWTVFWLHRPVGVSTGHGGLFLYVRAHKMCTSDTLHVECKNSYPHWHDHLISTYTPIPQARLDYPCYAEYPGDEANTGNGPWPEVVTLSHLHCQNFKCLSAPCEGDTYRAFWSLYTSMPIA